MELDERKIGAVVSHSNIELELNPVKGKFYTNHLKEIHRRISKICLKWVGISHLGNFDPL